VTAQDIDLPAGIEILNPGAHIATLEQGTRIEMYLTIGRGRGYSPAEDNKNEDQPIGVIPIDSIFSPVKRVAYQVEAARVGQRTDFDKLTLDVETDGSKEPEEALAEAAEILISRLSIFTEADRVDALRGAPEVDGDFAGVVDGAGGARRADGMDEILIEELELGVRSYNCLKRAGIQTVGELLQRSESELAAIPNFGSKSIEEVRETLRARGLSLREA
jgi:DNA-directed RNA polymerase subunit alpha